MGTPPGIFRPFFHRFLQGFHWKILRDSTGNSFLYVFWEISRIFFSRFLTRNFWKISLEIPLRISQIIPPDFFFFQELLRNSRDFFENFFRDFFRNSRFHWECFLDLICDSPRDSLKIPPGNSLEILTVNPPGNSSRVSRDNFRILKLHSTIS